MLLTYISFTDVIITKFLFADVTLIRVLLWDHFINKLNIKQEKNKNSEIQYKAENPSICMSICLKLLISSQDFNFSRKWVTLTLYDSNQLKIM